LKEVVYRVTGASRIPHHSPAFSSDNELKFTKNSRIIQLTCLHNISDESQTIARIAFMNAGQTVVEPRIGVAPGNFVDFAQNCSQIFQRICCHYDLHSAASVKTNSA
jgi:hypothetical protein